MVSTSKAMIKHLKLEIARLRREHYGHGSERRARLIDQMELQLEELEAAGAEVVTVEVVFQPSQVGGASKQVNTATLNLGVNGQPDFGDSE